MSEEWKQVDRVSQPNPSGGYPQAGGNAQGGWQTVPSAGQGYGTVPPPPPGYPAYAPPSPYGAPVPAKKSHTVRNVVLIVFTVVLLLVAGCGAVIYKGLTVLRDSRPTQLAVQTAENNPIVQAKLGTPLKTSMLITGNVNTSLQNGVKTGTADLKVNVTGPKAKGTLLASETLTPGGWKIVSLTLSDESGNTPLVAPTVLPGASREETF